VTTVYCEFEDPKKYREAVRMCRETRVESREPADNPRPSTLDPRPSSWLLRASSRPGEEWTLEQVRSCNADGYLVRNYDHLKFFAN
jgi:U32 family peptidase